jgi:hypothetical protein
VARGMVTTSWGGQDVAVLMDMSENKSCSPRGCAVHLRTPTMAAASRGGNYGRARESKLADLRGQEAETSTQQPASKHEVYGKV